MKTVLIENKKKVEHPVIALLLEQYNEGLDEPIYIEAKEKAGCFPAVRTMYAIYQEVGDMRNHYTYIHTLEESNMLTFLAQILNEKEKNTGNETK
jgi:hypothetical protein